MKPEYDKLLSSLAFSFNLRRYSLVLCHGRAVQVDRWLTPA